MSFQSASSDAATSSSPGKRQPAVLARYGGQAGPTGTASAGSGASPVSLASFMGGKAAGPRLGKLVGDGKNAPPEAELIHEDYKYGRGVPLPGLAAPGGAPGSKSLASFLEARAQQQGNASPHQRPSSPVKSQSIQIPTSGQAASGAGGGGGSPVPAASRDTPSSSSSSSQLPAPSRTTPLRGLTDPASASTTTAPSSASPQKSSSGVVSPGAVSQSPSALAAPSPVVMKDASTSPLSSSPKKESFAASSSPPKKESSTTSSSSLPSSSSSSAAPTQSVHRLRSEGMVAQRLREAKERQAGGPTIAAAAADPAAAASASERPAVLASNSHPSGTASGASTPRATASPSLAPTTSKWPTVSPAASLAHSSSVVGNPGGTTTSSLSSSSSSSKWPPVSAAPSLNAGAAASTTSSSTAPRDLPPPSRWNPARSGNALPGLSRPASSSTASSSSPTGRASPTRASYEERQGSAADLPPVRLPGMGGPVSPFKSGDGGGSGNVAAAGYFNDAKADAAAAEAAPLESLTSNRARGPARSTPRSAGAGTASNTVPSLTSKLPGTDEADPTRSPQQPSTGASASDAAATQSPSPPTPRRNTTGPRIVVLISGSGSNLQALIDATQPNAPLSHAQISYVLSNRKAAYGLQRAAQSNPPIPTRVLAFKTWQNANGGVGTREEYDEVLAKAVLDGNDGSPPDLIVLAGFMHIVSPQFLRALGHKTDLPDSGCPPWRPSKPIPIINLHPALPGAFDGVNAIARAYEAYQAGTVDHTGIMVHEVVAEVDRGTPIVVEQVAIYNGESLEDLEKRMHDVEHQLIVKGARITLDKARGRR